jgi:histone deacetylase complex regulatory component SIN3
MLVLYLAFFRNLPVAALKAALKTAAIEQAITLIVTSKQQTLPPVGSFSTLYSPLLTFHWGLESVGALCKITVC